MPFTPANVPLSRPLTIEHLPKASRVIRTSARSHSVAGDVPLIVVAAVSKRQNLRSQTSATTQLLEASLISPPRGCKGTLVCRTETDVNNGQIRTTSSECATHSSSATARDAGLCVAGRIRRIGLRRRGCRPFLIPPRRAPLDKKPTIYATTR